MGTNNENSIFSRNQHCSHNASEQWTEDDYTLVLAARRGDPSAFSTLVERHSAAIFTLAKKLLSDTDEAEDATQETFIRAYNRLETFGGRSAFATWLYRIGINICHDHLRRRLRRQQIQERYMEIRGIHINRSWPNECHSLDPEHAVLALEKFQTVSRALAQLSISYRTTLLLHDIEGLTISKVATLTKVPLSTAKSRLRRARLTLVTLLKEKPTAGSLQDCDTLQELAIP
jgi:RNA polymerase sigma-70 factor, ECF subfamily